MQSYSNGRSVFATSPNSERGKKVGSKVKLRREAHGGNLQTQRHAQRWDLQHEEPSDWATGSVRKHHTPPTTYYRR